VRSAGLFLDSLLAVTAHPLAHVDALLNSLAFVLLVIGFVLIKQGRENAHKWVMLAAFGVSAIFLVCYLTHHYLVGSVKYPSDAPYRNLYLSILLTHIVLAATVPFLAGATIYFGLKDLRRRHLQFAKFTFPIWLYVSITGVLVYGMLYHLVP
jgi:putative membrane protein